MNRRGFFNMFAAVPLVGSFFPVEAAPLPATAVVLPPTALSAVRDLLMPALRGERSSEYSLGDRRIIDADISVDYLRDCLFVKAFTKNRTASWIISRADIENRSYLKAFGPMNQRMGAWLIESDEPSTTEIEPEQSV